MKHIRKYIRQILLESTTLEPVQSFFNDINSIFEVRDNIGLVKTFHDGCEVIFNISRWGSADVYWENIKTVDAEGNETEDCFRKGYARSVMNQVLDVADKYQIFIELEAQAFGEKSTADDNALISFYRSLGFNLRGDGFMEREPT